MDALKQWALCLILASVAGTFAVIISPRGSSDKTIKIVAGIFVVSAICSPLSEIIKLDSLETMLTISDYSGENSEQLREFLIDSFCSELEMKINSVLAEYNVVGAEIYINADIDADNCIIIRDVSVEIDGSLIDEKEEIGKRLKDFTGMDIAVISK